MAADEVADPPVYSCEDITCDITEEFVCDLGQDPVCQCPAI